MTNKGYAGIGLYSLVWTSLFSALAFAPSPSPQGHLVAAFVVGAGLASGFWSLLSIR